MHLRAMNYIDWFMMKKKEKKMGDKESERQNESEEWIGQWKSMSPILVTPINW